MSKYVSRSQLEAAIAKLREFPQLVAKQRIQHLLPFLALKQKGAAPAHELRFEEEDDFAFWNKYFKVDESGMCYYDPFAGQRRIRTHPHSNVATARKQTFANSWQAASFRIDEDGTAWTLAENYLQILVSKCLTRAGQTNLVPALPLIAWLRRHHTFDDGTSVADMVDEFKSEFRLTVADFAALFVVTGAEDEAFFDGTALTTDDVLEVIGPAEAPVVDEGTLNVSAGEVASGLVTCSPKT